MKKGKKTILIIEDDSAILEVYKIVLNKAGFSVEDIGLGREALARIGEINAKTAEKPDLILLDLLLPDMNGISLLEEMRKHEETKDIPVFILTNYTDKDLEKRGKELSAKKFIIKTDYTPRELLKVIKEELKK